MKLSRRGFVKSSMVCAAPWASACGSDENGKTEGGDAGQPPPPDFNTDTDPFLHGLASGDPLTDRVVLWTRVTVAAPPEELNVRFVVARDPELSDVVVEGFATTNAELDFTVKVDVDGLEPGTSYYYRFAGGGFETKVARTRTLPEGDVERLRFAVVSCSNYAGGYFNVYRLVAERTDLDAVLHLGDYIYEYGDDEYGGVRTLDPPHEILTLEDYRRRHAHYKTDADLQELHRQHVYIGVWDDHETADNSHLTGAVNHQADEGDWGARREAGLRAFFEWVPIREIDMDDKYRIYRTLPFGNLVDLVMLDTRMAGRDKQPGTGFFVAPDTPGLDDDTVQLLGETQEQWLFDTLANSQATWRLLGQQVMMGQLALADGTIVNADQWDGYPKARARVFDFIQQNAIDNLVVLTGDIHTAWAMEITPDQFSDAYDPTTGAGALAVEFVTSSVTSPGLPGFEDAAGEQLARDNMPHLKYVNLRQRGYVVLDVTKERVQGEWYMVPDITVSSTAEEVGALYTVASGTPHLVEASEPTAPYPNPPAPAP